MARGRLRQVVLALYSPPMPARRWRIGLAVACCEAYRRSGLMRAGTHTKKAVRLWRTRAVAQLARYRGRPVVREPRAV
jgi:hypothetical protein